MDEIGSLIDTAPPCAHTDCCGGDSDSGGYLDEDRQIDRQIDSVVDVCGKGDDGDVILIDADKSACDDDNKVQCFFQGRSVPLSTAQRASAERSSAEGLERCSERYPERAVSGTGSVVLGRSPSDMKSRFLEVFSFFLVFSLVNAQKLQ